jgi:hypothetical protein
VLVSGSSRNPTEDLTIWRFETSLTLASRWTTGGKGIEAGWSVSTRPGEVFVGGFTDSFGNGYADAYLHYQSAAASWNTTWGGTAWDSAYAVDVEAEYLYVLIATHSIGNGGGDPALMKMTKSGEIEWFRPWGGSLEDSGLGVVFVGDRVYWTGYTNSYGNGSRDIYLVGFTESTEPRTIAKAEVWPGEAQVAAGSTFAFQGRAFDQWGAPITNALLEWSAADEIGTVDRDGVFTATRAGAGEVRVRATYRGASAESRAAVEVYDPEDSVPPTVLWTDPANGSSGVRVGTRIAAGFSEPMDRNSTAAAIRIEPLLAGTFEWTGAEMRFTPERPLAQGRGYRVTIGADASDLAGNRLGSAFSFTFRTEEPVFLPGGDSAFLFIGGAAVLAAVLALSVAIAATVRGARPKARRKP